MHKSWRKFGLLQIDLHQHRLLNLEAMHIFLETNGQCYKRSQLGKELGSWSYISFYQLQIKCADWWVILQLTANFSMVLIVNAAIRTYAHRILANLLVSLCIERYGEKEQPKKIKKNKKNAWSSVLSHGRIWNFNRVCADILVTQLQSIMWYELNKKLWNILLLVPIPSHASRKPTWQSRIWWLAKFAWYDATWKTSIQTCQMYK